MMRIPLPAFVLLVLITVPPISAARAEPDYLAPEVLQPLGLTKFWQVQLPLSAGQQVEVAFLVDDTLYLGTNDGYAYSVHAATGTVRWLRPITRLGYQVRRPAHAGEHVIFATPTDVQIYVRRNGDPVLRRELDFPGGTGVVSDGTLFFVGGLDRRLYAFGTDDHYVHWRAVASAPIVNAPVLYGTAEDAYARGASDTKPADLFVADEDGEVYAAARARKAFRWHTALKSAVTAELTVAENGLYVASRDMSLYLLDRDFGTIRWQARLSSPLLEPPLVTPELVYQYSAADGVVAIEPTTIGVVEERVRWKAPSARRALAAHDGTVYCQMIDDRIAAVRTRDGQVLASAPNAGLTLGVPAVVTSAAGVPTVDAALYLAAANGRVFCARPRGATPPSRDDILSALRPAPATQPAGAPAPTTQPAARPAVAPEDPLQTRQTGAAPAGGKSKVSRDFKGEEKSE